MAALNGLRGAITAAARTAWSTVSLRFRTGRSPHGELTPDIVDEFLRCWHRLDDGGGSASGSGEGEGVVSGD